MTTTAVRTKPILFSGPMVRSILDGRKTQTRRVVQPQPTSTTLCGQRMWTHATLSGDFGEFVFGGCMASLSPCPYGRPGDLLWVREAWRYHDRVPISAMDGKGVARRNIVYRADAGNDGTTFRPSIHMPRWACRLWLRVTDVRVQRVQEISEDDAVAEGCAPLMLAPGVLNGNARVGGPKREFAALWDSINGKRPGCSWADNPWVWAITFERTEAPRC